MRVQPYTVTIRNINFTNYALMRVNYAINIDSSLIILSRILSDLPAHYFIGSMHVHFVVITQWAANTCLSLRTLFSSFV